MKNGCVRFGFISLVMAVTASAQCASAWLPTVSIDANGPVHASVLWDPDGSGPQRARLVLGGAFSEVTAAAANNVVSIDPETGVVVPLGAGLGGTVRALTVLANGDLVAGGAFYNSGGTAVSSVARWSGSAWQPIGGGVGSIPFQDVYALAALPGGGFVAGGVFTWAGSVTAFYVARWDGAAWQSLGGGMNAWVGSLAVLANGDIVAGGQFTTAGGVPANRVARWDGANWNALGAGVDSYVTSLAAMPNGDLVAGGWFQTAGGAPASCIARWDGSAWSTFGSGCNAVVNTLLAEPSGDVVAAGAFTTAGGVPCARIARFVGGTAQALGSGFDAPVRTLARLPDGDLVAGGDFVNSGSDARARLARWHSGTWERLIGAFTQPGAVLASTVASDGAIVVSVVDAVLRWSGSAWLQLGANQGYSVTGLAAGPQGQLAATAYFGLRLWNGSAWTNVAMPFQSVRAMVWTPSGHLVVAGLNATFASEVQRWDGVAWNPMPGLPPYSILCVAIRANGDVVVGGLQQPGPFYATPVFAHWNGAIWQGYTLAPSGGYLNVGSLVPLPSGDVVIAGAIANNANVQLWNGSTVVPLGAFGGPVGTQGGGAWVARLPTGEVVASSPVNPASRWSGSAWVPLRPEVGQQLLVLPDGDIASFTTQKRFTTTCRAAARMVATACVGPAGPLSLVADSQPWIGTTFASTSTGFAVNGIGVSVFGFARLDLPLSSLVSGSLPDCNLLPTPDVVQLCVPVAGACTQSLPLPSLPALTGLFLDHQFVQVELGGPTGIVSVSSSAGLSMTIGGY